jgi:Fic family protein
MDAGLVLLLTEAEAALAELSAAVEQSPELQRLAPAFLGLEAMYSCRLGGDDVRLADLYLAQAGALGATDARAAQAGAIWRCASGLQHGRGLLRRAPFDLALVEQLRDWLDGSADASAGTSPVTEPDAAAAIVGRAAVRAGAPATPRAALLPALGLPAAQRIALEAWAHFAADDRVWMPPLVRCALLHAQFEAIRAFEPGHGTLSRLLVPLYLVSRRQLSAPLWCLSAYWHAHQTRYRARLRQATALGVWEPWLEFFLLGVRAAARVALIHAHDLLRLRERLQRDARGIANADVLIEALLVNPYTTPQRVCAAIGRSAPTASALIRALVDRGLLREVTGRQRNRVYLMPRLLSAIERLPPMA